MDGQAAFAGGLALAPDKASQASDGFVGEFAPSGFGALVSPEDILAMAFRTARGLRVWSVTQTTYRVRIRAAVHSVVVAVAVIHVLCECERVLLLVRGPIHHIGHVWFMLLRVLRSWRF